MYRLVLNVSADTMDFTIGLLKIRLNKKVKFRSSGIARKLVLLILLVYQIPGVLLMLQPLEISALYIGN